MCYLVTLDIYIYVVLPTTPFAVLHGQWLRVACMGSVVALAHSAEVEVELCRLGLENRMHIGGHGA